jgi:hypothetical protein
MKSKAKDTAIELEVESLLKGLPSNQEWYSHHVRNLQDQAKKEAEKPFRTKNSIKVIKAFAETVKAGHNEFSSSGLNKKEYIWLASLVRSYGFNLNLQSYTLLGYRYRINQCR